MRLGRSSVITILLTAASAGPFAASAQAQVSINVQVRIAPPPLPYYQQPVIPAEGYLWVPGFWAWDQREADYYWVPGTWVQPPRRELLWTPAYWSRVQGRYVFHSGYWAREVGFYGGIDYGYGYTGEGYLGGRWERGAFFYNRSVNNVESLRITNVYNQTVVVNNRTTNVSFNGGDGGTSVKPTPQQEAIAKERHVEATPLQRQQVQTASKDRALFSKQNNGEPAVAATPRPGVFQGAGVSRGSRTPVAVKSNEEPASKTPQTKAGEPSKAGEQPKSAQQPREAQPPTNEKEAPKAEGRRTPAGDRSKIEEQRKPSAGESKTEDQRKPPERPKSEDLRRQAQEPKAEEQRRPAQAPKAEEQRRPAQAPKAEEQRRPAQEPKAEEQRRPAQAPKAEEQRRPAQEPKAEEQRRPAQAPKAEEQRRAPPEPRRAEEPRGGEMKQTPRPERPTGAPGGRPPAEEK